MIPSDFNYRIIDDNKVIFFNGIRETFFVSSLQNAEYFDDVINHPDEYKAINSAFVDGLLAKGFIKDEKDDEIIYIDEKMRQSRQPGVYSLMILPTYQCNLRCWYCIQNHQSVKISEKTVEKIKRRIAKKCHDSNINHIRLSWFGGEPLMEFESVRSLTEFASAKAKESGKSFICDITTNATLLTPERVDILRSSGVTGYQISIDGTKKLHDTVKVLKGRSAFDNTISIINYAAKNTLCILRLNYTPENLNPDAVIHDITERLDIDVRKNVKFSLCKVWQENTANVDFELVRELASKSEAEGITCKFAPHGMCYADFYEFECIMPDGSVGKCDDLPMEKMPGYLNEYGDVVWSDDIDNYAPISQLNVESECKECRYFPLCTGPCPVDRAGMLRTEGTIRCKYEDRDMEMAQIIKGIVFKFENQR